MLSDSWTGHQLAHGYYDEQRKMKRIKQTTKWVGFALGDAAESVSGLQVGLHQAGAFSSKREWGGRPGCKEMTDHVHHLNGNHAAVFWSQRENKYCPAR